MTNVVRTKAKDGSTVEFIYSDPKQGGMKDVYFAPDKSYVVAFFRNKLDHAGLERIEKIVGTYRKNIFQQEGGDYWKNVFCWPEKIVEYEGKIGIVVPAYRKCFFFGPGMFEGAEKEGKWFASPKNFNRFVPEDEKGDLAKFLRICLMLSRGVRRLHAAGLAHSDLSYKNCLIDPKGGNACIIDLDGLVVPGIFPPDVLGTPDFIAPEVVASQDPGKKRVLPSSKTDLHALATLVYLYLFHRHPLRGSKVWSSDDAEQEKFEMGEKALFIENKTDTSNSVKIDSLDKKLLPWVDPSRIPYALSGPYLTSLFDRAFIDGLHDPQKRPTASEWEDALIKTTDLIVPCAGKDCVKKWFVYNNERKPVCPYCGTRYPHQLPVFDFYVTYDGAKYLPEKRRLMAYHNQSFYQWHLNRYVSPNEKLTPEQSKRVAYLAFHQGQWLLVNQAAPELYNLSKQEPIPVGKAVPLTDGLQLLLSGGKSGRVANIKIANV